MNKSFLAGLAAIAIVFAGVGFYVASQVSQNGGSSAPSYQVAGDPNYAVAVYSTSSPSLTLGNYAAATGTVTSTLSLPRGLSYGLKQGDTCAVQFSQATSTGGFSEDAQITAIGQKNATVTVTFFNGASTALIVATGTITVACQNF